MVNICVCLCVCVFISFDFFFSNRKRLKASEFVAGNKDEIETLAKMGISVITMTDGRVQLLHTAADVSRNTFFLL